MKFCGSTEFASGHWAGIALNDAVGKNDGTVAGIRYFNCEPKHGEDSFHSLSYSMFLCFYSIPQRRKRADLGKGFLVSRNPFYYSNIFLDNRREKNYCISCVSFQFGKKIVGS